MSPLVVYWSQVPDEAAPRLARAGKRLFALWPGPVDPGSCLEAAGCRDAAVSDERWELDAEAMLTRLLGELTRFGTPHLVSEPYPVGPWWRGFFRPRPVDVRAQLELLLRLDGLEDCTVGFGEAGVTLRTGGGHHLFWVSLPEGEAVAFPAILAGTAALHPVARADLDWGHLA